ncbi:MAG: glycosyltransferase [Dehalobacterium sp.]
MDFLIFDQVVLNHAISLVDQIPEWINVCDAAANEGSVAYIKKAFYRLYRKITKRQLFRKSAADFVKDKAYDFAFSYGEWMSPEFVATKVKAKKKAIWIHTDIDKSPFVDERILFRYDQNYQYYIFASERSRQSAIKKYPLIGERSYVIHNMCDDTGIRLQSGDPLPEHISMRSPVLVTVANIRPEKNHIRQVEAMHLLNQQGINFTWINVGCASHSLIFKKLKKLIKQYDLEKYFLLVGADSNPYKYMSHADAVAVLSDYESWSMVITEAKLLGIPVIATKTSGALEQIEDKVNGVLTEFDAEHIAENIKNFLGDKKLQCTIKSNLQDFTTKTQTMQEFEVLLLGADK